MRAEKPGTPADATVSDPTVNVDLASTILAATGTTMPAGKDRPADGTSLMPLMQGDGDPDRAVLIEGRDDAEPSGSSGAYEAVSYQGVRTSRYLYVEWHRAIESSSQAAADAPIGTGPVVGRELYDTQLDPYELDNRVGSAAYEPSQDELASILARLETCAGSDCVVSAAIPPPAGG